MLANFVSYTVHTPISPEQGTPRLNHLAAHHRGARCEVEFKRLNGADSPTHCWNRWMWRWIDLWPSFDVPQLHVGKSATILLGPELVIDDEFTYLRCFWFQNTSSDVNVTKTHHRSYLLAKLLAANLGVAVRFNHHPKEQRHHRLHLLE